MRIDKPEFAKIAKKFGLRLIVLFGSQASQNTHPKSDVDIAFLPSQQLDEELLYRDVVRVLNRADVDLVNLRNSHDHLVRFEILHHCEVIFEEKEGLKDTMEWESWIDYVDFKRYYEMRSKLLDEKITKLEA